LLCFCSLYSTATSSLDRNSCLSVKIDFTVELYLGVEGRKMAYRYTCSVCDREFKDDSRSELIDKVQNHADRQHDTSMNRDDIEEDIEEN
jgi:predicted small metal-binding protein